jgi:hypothetical protein
MSGHVTVPTRYREGQEPSKLDLIFTDDKNSVENLQCLAPIGKSDHIGLAWTTITHLDPNSLDGRPKGRNYWKGDFESINTEIMALDWQAVQGEMDTDDAWQELERRIGNLCDKYAENRKRIRERDG